MSSTFNSNDEGWSVVSFNDLAAPNYSTKTSYPVTYNVTGGNSGGYISTGDTDSSDFAFSAPASFLGNQSTTYNTIFSYDISHIESASYNSASDVFLRGGEKSLLWKSDPALEPSATWTNVKVLLAPSPQWHVGALDGPLATAADFQNVLANLAGVFIRGEYSYGADTAGLDNVQFSSSTNNPPPSDNFENSTPTGDVIIKGDVKIGNELSIVNTLDDADGLGDFYYQWLSNGNPIENANTDKYKITNLDTGKKISVEVSYIDGLANQESKISAETVTVKTTSVVINGLTKVGDAKNNKLEGSDKNDALSGLAGADILIGKAGNDSLSGGEGNDNLTGGLGFDELTGDSGADKFIFTNIKEVPISRSNIEVITDFKTAEGDKIDLSGIDANTSIAKNQAFSFPIIGNEFSGIFTQAGQLYFDTSSSVLYGNVNADATADFAIQLTGVTNLNLIDLSL